MTTETANTISLIDRQIANRREVFAFWKKHGPDAESYAGNNPKVLDGFKELGNFNEYGLELVFEPASSHAPGHFRFLLSTGDPHEELRFFPNGRIQFVSMPWFEFHKKPVTSDPVFRWVRDYLHELSCLDFWAHCDELYYE